MQNDVSKDGGRGGGGNDDLYSLFAPFCHLREEPLTDSSLNENVT